MSAEPADHSRSQALLIGTSVYDDTWFPSLPAVANSLREMRTILTDLSLCGWPLERTVVIEDPVDVRKVVQRLRRVARATTDVLLVYFAGHGTITPRGQLCMVFKDTDSDDVDITGLEFERLRSALLESPAHTKIVILDCCYSGRAIEALAGNVADSTDTRGVYTLTASDHTAHVVALEHQGDRATSFTQELVDLVRSGIPGGPDRLTLSDIYFHLRRRLQAAGLPAPNQRGTDTADRYAFTRNATFHPDAPSAGAETRAETVTESEPGGRAETQAEPDVTAEAGTRAEPDAQAEAGTRAEPDAQAEAGTRGERRMVRRRTVLLAGLGALAAAAVPTAMILSRPDGTTPPAPGPVTQVEFRPGGKTLATASYDSPTVRMWDWPGGRFIRALRSSAISGVYAMAFSPGGERMALAGSTLIELWNPAGPTLLHTLAGHTDAPDPRITGSSGASIPALAFSPDGKILASGGFDRSVRLWDGITGATQAVLTGHTGGVESLAFHPDGKILASAGYDATVRLWDPVRGHALDALPAGGTEKLLNVAFSPDGKILAAGGLGRGITLWDAHTRDHSGTLKVDDSALALAFSPDSKVLAVGDYTGTIVLLAVGTGSAVTTLTGHKIEIADVAFSLDGKVLASASFDGTARLWDLSGGAATLAPTATLLATPAPSPSPS
ncbi:caspase, EACC1-associated type [Sphaerisporangium sp. NPDC004334]